MQWLVIIFAIFLMLSAWPLALSALFGLLAYLFLQVRSDASTPMRIFMVFVIIAAVGLMVYFTQYYMNVGSIYELFGTIIVCMSSIVAVIMITTLGDP